MSDKSQKIRLEPHLWGHLDGMASGMGKSPEVLLERAVTTLLNLHGYAVAHQVGAPEARSLGEVRPPATKVEGVDHKMPVITGIASKLQPTIPGMPAPRASSEPTPPVGRAPTAAALPDDARPGASRLLVDLPASLVERAPDDDDDDYRTQVSMAHRGSVLPHDALGGAAPLASGFLPPVAAGELITGSRVPDKPALGSDDDDAPFVSDVIAVPSELYSADSGLIAAPPPQLAAPPETDAAIGATTDAVPAAQLEALLEGKGGPRAESFTAPQSDVTPAHAPHESFTAPRSDLNRVHVESFTAPRSDLSPVHQPPSVLTEVPVDEDTQTPPSGLTQLSDSELTAAPLSEVTHAPVSEETQAPEAELTHAPLSEETQAPEAELTQAPGDVPWETAAEPLPGPRAGALPPPPEPAPAPEPAPELAPEVEEPPREPPPPSPDADPARMAAAARIRAIDAELEKHVLPREDKPFTIDLGSELVKSG